MSKLVASLWESIRQTKTIVGKQDDDVPAEVGRQAHMNEDFVWTVHICFNPIVPIILKTNIFVCQKVEF